MADDEKAWAELVHDLAKRPVADKESSYKELPHSHDEVRADLAPTSEMTGHKARFSRLIAEAVKGQKSR